MGRRAYATATEAQAALDQLTSAGFRPLTLSTVIGPNGFSSTGLYTMSNPVPFTAVLSMSEGNYQLLINAMAQQGRRLSYLNVFDNGAGTPLFTAVFDETPVNSQAVLNASDAGAVEAEHVAQQNLGRTMRFVTGYTSGMQALFSALLTD